MAKKQRKTDTDGQLKQPETVRPVNLLRIGQLGDYKPIPKFNFRCPNC